MGLFGAIGSGLKSAFGGGGGTPITQQNPVSQPSGTPLINRLNQDSGGMDSGYSPGTSTTTQPGQTNGTLIGTTPGQTTQTTQPSLANGMNNQQIDAYTQSQYQKYGRTADQGALDTWRGYYNSPAYASGQGSDFWNSQMNNLLGEYQQYGNHDRSAAQLAQYQGQNNGSGNGFQNQGMNPQMMQQMMPMLMQMFQGMNKGGRNPQQISQGQLFNQGGANNMDVSSFVDPDQMNRNNGYLS